MDIRALVKQWLGTGPAPAAAAVPAAAIAGDSAASHALVRAGMEHLRQRRFAEAAESFARALDRAPDDPHAHNGLGLALLKLGQPVQARARFTRALELDPSGAEALANLGALDYQDGEYDDAADNFHVALAHDPRCESALLGLGRLLVKAGKLEEGIEHLRRAVEFAPASAQAQFDLGFALAESDDVEGAMRCYQRALELDPAMAEAHVNLGVLYSGQLGDVQRASEEFRAAMAARPDMLEAHANFGGSLQDQGRFDEAQAFHEAAIAAHPEFDEFRWNRGLGRLLQGDFARGWADYEVRRTRAGGKLERSFPLREWHGEPLAGRALLVYAEQGLGDEIMFASCLPDAIRESRHSVIECDRRLEPLYRRSFPRASVRGAPRDGDRSWLAQFPELELQIPIGSLPRFFRPDRASFPAHAGYLRADPDRCAAWRARLTSHGGARSIGIAWRGGTRDTHQRLRSIELAKWAPLLRQRGASFVCLQRAPDAGEIAAAATQCGVEPRCFPEAHEDIEETAALIDALDLVITVDNTVAHLAGALGRPTWVLLCALPDWRWLWQGDTAPWYPSVRLLRQARIGEWAPVMERAATALAGFLGANADRGDAA